MRASLLPLRSSIFMRASNVIEFNEVRYIAKVKKLLVNSFAGKNIGKDLRHSS